jgi:hypothetical protein
VLEVCGGLSVGAENGEGEQHRSEAAEDFMWHKRWGHEIFCSHL